MPGGSRNIRIDPAYIREQADFLRNSHQSMIDMSGAFFTGLLQAVDSGTMSGLTANALVEVQNTVEKYSATALEQVTGMHQNLNVIADHFEPLEISAGKLKGGAK